MNDEYDKPTELTVDDINKFAKYLENYVIIEKECLCGKSYIPNYSHILCDECFFSRFPKEQVEAFYRSFFE